MEDKRVNEVEQSNNGEEQQNVETEVLEESEENNNNIEEVSLGEEKVQKKKKKLNKKAKVILCASAAFVLIAAAVIVSIVVKANKRATYVTDMRECSYMMLLGASQAEDICNLTKDVWYNTIFKKTDEETNQYTIKPDDYSPGRGYYYDYHFNDDFNTSISALYKSKYMKEKLDALKSRNEDVDEAQRKLSNPPKGFEREYDTFLDLTDAYFNLTRLAEEPSGSLQSYADKLSEYDTEFISLYEKLDRQLPET